MCPHLSWVIRLDWSLVNLLVRLRYELKGKLSSISASLSYLVEFSQFSSHLPLSFLWYACLVAEALIGSGLLSIWGSLILSLECLFAASLANSSTFSFPLTLLWLEIHLTVRLHPTLFARRVRCLMRCCPEVALRFFIDEIMAWLSM